MSEQGRVWVVTGAASGMGRAISQAVVSQGGEVIAINIDEPGLASLKNEAPEHLQMMAVDLRDPKAIEEFASYVKANWSALDVLVNCAGAARLEATSDVTPGALDWQYELLLRGPMILTRALLPSLKAAAAPVVVNISSIGAVVNVPMHAGYAACKAGLEKYTRIFLRENPGIRANVIQPGFINTPLLLSYGPEEEVQTLLDDVAARVPTGRCGTPEDIANAALFLASPAAGYINGAELLVDGGYCAGPFDF